MNLIFKTPTRRVCIDESEAQPAQCCAVANALAFHWMGSGNSKASTSSTDNRVAATGLSQVQQGSSAKATDNAILVKDSSKILAPGAVENQGNITVTGASDKLVSSVLQSVSDVIAKAEDNQAAGQQQLAGILNGAVTSLADTKQKEGEAQRNMNQLWIVLGAFALLALVLMRIRK
jgi:hypothetical protein